MATEGDASEAVGSINGTEVDSVEIAVSKIVKRAAPSVSASVTYSDPDSVSVSKSSVSKSVVNDDSSKKSTDDDEPKYIIEKMKLMNFLERKRRLL
jgi:hypothetical protein